MLRNTAGQTIGAQMLTAADGTAFTGSVTVHVTGDGGTQATGSVGSGACVHEGNGYHSYAPAQAETNYAHVAFTFVGTGAAPATVQVYTKAGDAFTRLGAPVGASISADIAGVQSDTNDIQTRLPAALVSGRIDASVGAMAANVLTATAINADAFTAAKFAADVTTEFQSGLATAADLATVDAVVDAILVDTAEIGTAGAGLTALASQASVNDLPTNAELATALGTADDAVLEAIATVDANVDTILVTTNKLDDTLEDSGGGAYVFTEAALAAGPSGSGPTAADIADAVWEEPIAAHSGTAGSTAEALNAAGSAGDPWVTALPGAYGAGSAGFILGTNLNATVSSRASQSALDTVDGIVDSILVDTDAIDARLPSDPADASVIASATNAILTAVDGVPTTAEFEARTIVSANYATAAAVADLPTNAELATALTGADDSILAVLGAPAGASLAADLAAVKADTAAVLLDTGTDGVVVATASKTGYALSAAGVDAIHDEAVDGATTLRESVRLANSVLGGKVSGMETTEVTFRDLADTKDRVVATVDGTDGNRTAVTRDLT